MIGHKYTPTVGHTGSYAFGDHVRRNLGATVVELGIPPALAVGSVNCGMFVHEQRLFINARRYLFGNHRNHCAYRLADNLNCKSKRN